MTSIIDTLNRAYDIEEGRPWWKVRLTAIGLTVGVALFILLSFTLILAGPTLAERLPTGPARERVRMGLEDPPVAAGLRARQRRIRAHLLLRAGRRAGLGVADARVRLRHHAVAGGLARLQVLRRQLGPYTSRTAPSAA